MLIKRQTRQGENVPGGGGGDERKEKVKKEGKEGFDTPLSWGYVFSVNKPVGSLRSLPYVLYFFVCLCLLSALIKLNQHQLAHFIALLNDNDA